MRLLELEIAYTRGILALKLAPDGKNLVIWGPNGSGKSAVVDAIDFLLTGKISRLSGRGAGELSLSEHGPHVDHSPEEAVVCGTFQVPGVPNPLKLTRCFGDPTTLVYDYTQQAALAPILALAQRGQHVLSRREILKYIWAEAGSRAEQIQELLNLKEVEAVRQALVTAQNELNRELATAQSNLHKVQSELTGSLQLPTFDHSAVLEVANRNRALLGGQGLFVLSSSSLRSGITPPKVVALAPTVNISLLESDVRAIIKLLSPENEEVLGRTHDELRATIRDVKADPALLHELSHRELIEMGMILIDESGRCPLCDTEWPSGKLREHLQTRLDSAERARAHADHIGQIAAKLADLANRLRALLPRPLAASDALGDATLSAALRGWLTNLDALSKALMDPIRSYPYEELDTSHFKQLIAPPDTWHSIEGLLTVAQNRFPATTPEQNAWDLLTQLEVRLGAVETATKDNQLAELFATRAATLKAEYIKSRDRVLGGLYGAIRDRFVYLYRQLHGPDEAGFSARIEPDEAALRIEVDFYGRGPNPPHALHSEGHQDSMGVCLFLALAEHLSTGLMDLVVLDDVVMSADADHRRQLCTLLATQFPNRQFLITTHDRNWATQLRAAGVVDRKGSIEFFNWSIDTGPQVNYEADMWDRIEKHLSANDMTSVASTLRRGLEEFFALACDYLQAKVTYRILGRHELGDLLPAAAGRYLDLIREAKRAARSWGDAAGIERLNELASIMTTVLARTNAEHWAINDTLHYNHWASSTANDMRPVIDAMRDLQLQFVCTTCGGLLAVIQDRMIDSELKCPCGKVHWNLLHKSDTPKTH